MPVDIIPQFANTWACSFTFITFFLDIVHFEKCLLNLILSSEVLYFSVSRTSSMFLFSFYMFYI